MPSSCQVVRGRTTKILILNPNSSRSMTDGLCSAIEDPILDLPYSTEIHTYTAPAPAPASINDGADIAQSMDVVLSDLGESDRDSYDGILVACFSVHPLVGKLQGRSRAVIGIFEASILTALSLLPPAPPAGYEPQKQQQWGIVTTGEFWEHHLTSGVRAFLGGGTSSASSPNPLSRFAGVQSTGLKASDFHGGVPPEVIRQKLSEATKRLLNGGWTTVIVMGCAGMAGLEEIVRSAAAEEISENFAYNALDVVDGVRAGILQVEAMIKHQRLLTRKSTTA